MNFTKWDKLLLIIIGLSVVPGIILYGQLPDQIPTHWGMNGKPDGYSSKEFGVFFFPILNLGLFFLMLFLPSIDPRKGNYQKFRGAYTIFRWVFHLFLMGTYFLALYSAYQESIGETAINPGKFVLPGMGILFIVLGNYMGRFRHNYFVGIRTPWTLADERVWHKTHRLGGKLFVMAGIIVLLGAFVEGFVQIFFVIGPLLGVSLFLFGYSFFQYRKINS
ncbi:SdpI family protein [Pseudalkalibacillus caeni]|nr:SdpI family protein [Pseudalkalibacillus caeni]